MTGEGCAQKDGILHRMLARLQCRALSRKNEQSRSGYPKYMFLKVNFHRFLYLQAHRVNSIYTIADSAPAGKIPGIKSEQ